MIIKFVIVMQRKERWEKNLVENQTKLYVNINGPYQLSVKSKMGEQIFFRSVFLPRNPHCCLFSSIALVQMLMRLSWHGPAQASGLEVRV